MPFRHVAQGRSRRHADNEGVRRFLRYAGVGAVATAVHYAVLAVAVETSLLAPWWAAALGAWVGAQVAFAGNALITFAGAPVTVAAWLRFQIVALLGALISFSIVGAGVGAGLHYLVAQAIATLVSLFVTYEVNRRWSFAATPQRR